MQSEVSAKAMQSLNHLSSVYLTLPCKAPNHDALSNNQKLLIVITYVITIKKLIQYKYCRYKF